MNANNNNSGSPIADEVWHAVMQYVQLAMLTGTDVADYLRTIKIKLSADGSTHLLGDGQQELFDRQIGELVSRLDSMKTPG